ncbi:alpha-amylase family glycosyl hydrolase [Sphingomonas sp.]|uniref:alpha-amylase family glycosyl hydrolase n=1 Tax=Sphingomonas sp. TaxID=28214 RepID=UPI003CC5E092
MIARFLAFIALLLAPFLAVPAVAEVVHQPWTRDATIYELNVRQFSAQGTIAAAARQLPRLKRMGVTIVWVMPIQPIGVRERKGTLGSYYSISDYDAVNPAFGTVADFRGFVAQAHALGLKVILDWVANHTAWDHPWVAQHPDWYQRGADGSIHGYEYDNGHDVEHWSDVIGLDYRAPGVAPAVIAAMRFWLVETGIDGFRCDVAGRVPLAFWLRARAELERVKPGQFWLAEADRADLHRAFDMTYDWSLYHRLVDIAAGRADAQGLREWLAAEQTAYPADAYRMAFTSDHDENSWQGSDAELYRDHLPVFAVLAATLPGMPLVYDGQEAGLNNRLQFFERDPIRWGGYALQPFYTRLLALKRLPALANGAAGAPVAWIETGDDHVAAFRRVKQGHGVIVVANLSDAARTLTLPGLGRVTLSPWGYLLRQR